MCGLFCAHQAYAVQFVRTATRQWCTPRNQASVNWFGVGPGCFFILERGQHFKFRRKFRVVFISVAQNSRQIFATVIRNILADPPQANVPHAANARRIQHLQKCFVGFYVVPIKRQNFIKIAREDRLQKMVHNIQRSIDRKSQQKTRVKA